MLRQELAAERERWRVLTLYQKFEQIVVLALTGLIAIVVVSAMWSLAVNVLFNLLLSGTFDPTDYTMFQSVFGMIFTVIIAREFKRSLLGVTERKESVVHVRAVILITMLVIARKLIILDLARIDALQLVALAAATLSLGGVYWLVRDQDRRGSSSGA